MREPVHSLNLVRLSPVQRKELLERLERSSDGASLELPPHKNRRSSPRWPYRRHDISITIEHPGGGISNFIILSRNLSRGGMAFIHGGFIHPTTRCRIILSRPDGGEQVVVGRVLGCRHLEGPLHEVRVKFDQDIEPRSFLTVDEMSSEREDAGAGKNVMDSTQKIEDGVTDMLIQFIAHAEKMADELQQAMDQQNIDQVRAACADLKGSASGLGYTSLSVAADTALRMIDQTMSLDQCVKQIDDLSSMCRALAKGS